MQVLDFVGDAFFERVGNDLRELGGALGRRLAVGGQRFAGRQDDRDAPAGAHGRGLRELAGHRVDHHVAVVVAHHPLGWRAVAKMNDQRFGHRLFASKAALHGTDAVVASRNRTLYKTNSAVPMRMLVRSRNHADFSSIARLRRRLDVRVADARRETPALVGKQPFCALLLQIAGRRRHCWCMRSFAVASSTRPLAVQVFTFSSFGSAVT